VEGRAGEIRSRYRSEESDLELDRVTDTTLFTADNLGGGPVRFGKRPLSWRMAGVAAAVGLLVTALGSATTTTQAKSSGGGVVSFAELAGTPPTYISPLMSSSHESNANLYQFSNFMYLPLYWFGGDGQPELNKALSVANPPVFTDNDTVASITLKHWVWSDGQPLTARDVILWLNLLSAVTDPNAPTVGNSTNPGPGWFASVPGGFPENVVSYTQTGTYSTSSARSIPCPSRLGTRSRLADRWATTTPLPRRGPRFRELRRRPTCRSIPALPIAEL
jgi:hypothetical protein